MNSSLEKSDIGRRAKTLAIFDQIIIIQPLTDACLPPAGENGGGKGGRGGGKGKGGEEKKRKIEDSYLCNSSDACLDRTYLVCQTLMKLMVRRGVDGGKTGGRREGAHGL